MRPQPRVRFGVVSMHTSIHSESPESSDIPRAMVYGLYSALPGDRLSCHRRRRKPTDLTPASRRQDHTSSPSALASPVKRAATSTAPRPASVTSAKRPSEWDGMAMDIDLIWGGGEANYFLGEDWTGQITLKAFRKSVFARRAFSAKLLCREADRIAFFGAVGQIGKRDNLSTRRADELASVITGGFPTPLPRAEPIDSVWSADVAFGAFKSDIA
jgi:hypothetical protein